MYRYSITFLSLFFFIIGISGSFAQGKILFENASVSILTADSGNQLYSLFGHTAIRINDRQNNIDVVFNYGAFDFGTPNFYLKFVKGDLQYFVTTSTFEEFHAEYLYEGRAVYEQKLNLGQQQKQNIFNELIQDLSSEKRYYTYKFIDRNCTTMVVDKVNKNIRGGLNLKIKDSEKSNRRILYGYVENHFYENLGINIMFGAKTDKEFYKIYLPLQFMESISISKNNGLPLTDETKIVNPGKTETEPSFSFWNSCYSLILLLLVIVLVNRKSITLTYFVLLSALGVFLLSAGFFSLHEELHLNYNVLLFNPLLFLLVIFDLKNSKRWILITASVCIGMLAIYFILIFSKVHLLMFSPIIATNFILLGRFVLRKRKKLV